MRGRWIRIVVATLAGLLPAVTSAEDRALVLRAGTTGLGLDFAVSLSDTVSVRGSGALLGLATEKTESDIDYDTELRLRSLGGFVDLHPAGGDFRLSGGLVYSRHRIEATAMPASGTIELGGVSYPASQVGTLLGVGFIGSRRLAPYAGLGFGRPRGDGRVFFAFDLGLVFHGSPRIELSATGPLASNAQFQADLAAEEEELNADLDEPLYRYYPVVSFGIGFRF